MKQTYQNRQKKKKKKNCRPTTCLPITAQIWEDIYNSLISRELSLEGKKGCHKWTRGKAELLYIDQHILKEIKTRPKNLAMV